MRRAAVLCCLTLSLAGCGYLPFVEVDRPRATLVSRGPDGSGAELVVARSHTGDTAARLTTGRRGLIVTLGPADPGATAKWQAAGFAIAGIQSGGADPAAVAGLAGLLAGKTQDIALVGTGSEAGNALAAARQPGLRPRWVVLVGAAPDASVTLSLALSGADVSVLLPATADDAPQPALVSAITREKGCTPADYSDRPGLERQSYRCSDGRAVLLQRGDLGPDAITAAILPPPKK